MNRLSFLTLVILLIVSNLAEAVQHRYLTVGTVRARALAMGGAYHSIEDDFSAGFYNPAAFRVNPTRNERPFRLFFNPNASHLTFTTKIFNKFG